MLGWQNKKNWCRGQFSCARYRELFSWARIFICKLVNLRQDFGYIQLLVNFYRKQHRCRKTCSNFLSFWSFFFNKYRNASFMQLRAIVFIKRYVFTMDHIFDKQSWKLYPCHPPFCATHTSYAFIILILYNIIIYFIKSIGRYWIFEKFMRLSDFSKLVSFLEFYD